MLDQELILKLVELYDTADRFAREVEDYCNEPVIPAINQLRYAGHHLAKGVAASGAGDDEKSRKELLKAKGHCKRSLYDASDAGIVFVVEYLKEFRYDYRDLVIGEVIPNFVESWAVVNRALELLAQGRMNRTSVESHTEEYMENFRDLVEFSKVCDASRDELNAKREKAVVVRRRWLVGIIVVIALAVLRLVDRELVSILRELF